MKKELIAWSRLEFVGKFRQLVAHRLDPSLMEGTVLKYKLYYLKTDGHMEECPLFLRR